MSAEYSFRSFAECSDTHGLRHLVDRSSSRKRKVLWVTLMVASVTFLTYIVQLRITRYFEYPVSTTVKVQTGDVLLPSVRVCTNAKNVIFYDTLTASDIVNGLLEFMYGTMENGTDDRIIRFVVDALDLEGRKFTQKAMDDFQMTLEELEKIRSGKDSHSSSKDIIDTVRNSSYITISNDRGMDKFLRDINWVNIFRILVEQDTSIDVAARSDYSHYSALKTALSSSAERVRTLITWEDPDDGERLCTAKDKSTHTQVSCEADNWRTLIFDNERRSLVVNGDSAALAVCWEYNSRSTLALWLDIPHHDQFVTTGHSGNMHVYVEDHREDLRSAVFRDSVNNLKYGSMVNVHVKMAIELDRQPAPYGNDCQHTFDDGEAYSVSRCATHCALERLDTMCSGNWTTDKDCDFVSHYEFCRSADGGMCPDACKAKSFAVSVTVDNRKWDSVSHTSFFIRTDGTTNHLVIKEEPEYPADALVSELGGMMGLCIGVSMLTIAHCMEFALIKVWASIKNCFCPGDNEVVDAMSGKVAAGRKDTSDLALATIDDVYRIVALAVQNAHAKGAPWPWRA